MTQEMATSGGLSACFILLLTIPLWGSEAEWVKPSYLPHPLRKYDEGETSQWANLVDMDQFKKDHLPPILVVRPVGSANHRAVQKFLVETFRKLQWHVMQDKFNASVPTGKGTMTRKPFNNVVATLNPYATRRLVLAAHYDSKLFDDFQFLGATDSAVPCAMLVHMATILDPYLKNRTTYRDVTLQLIFFDGEEAFQEWSDTDSIYGARHLASQFEKTYVMTPKTLASLSSAHNTAGTGQEGPVVEDAKSTASRATLLQAMDVLVLLDLLGASAPTILSTQRPTDSLHHALYESEIALNRVGAMGTNKQRPTYFQPLSMNINAAVADDHLPFLQRGVPVVHAISLPFPSVWHTEADNAQAIDYTATERLLKVFTVFVARYLHLRPPTNAL